MSECLTREFRDLTRSDAFNNIFGHSHPDNSGQVTINVWMWVTQEGSTPVYDIVSEQLKDSILGELEAIVWGEPQDE